MKNDNFNSQFKKLTKAFQDGEKFVLFVGAGQNGGHNMHVLWNNLIKDSCKISFRQLLQRMDVSVADSKAILNALGVDENETEQCAKENMSEDEKKFFEYIRSHFPVEIQVSIIKTLMKDHYVPALQSCLYEQCNYDIIKDAFSLYAPICEIKNPPKGFPHLPNKKKLNKTDKELYTLFVIARMILLNGQIESVITYNFDNFIRMAVRILVSEPEMFFNDKEIEFLRKRYIGDDNKDKKLVDYIQVMDVHDNSVDSSQNIGAGTFPVYHVHGYIPSCREEEIVDSPEIVMALEDFVNQQTGGLSWQDAVQIKAFRDANILFIGCSITDLTMKRMINFAHAHGYRNKIFILSAGYYNNSDWQRRIYTLDRLRGWYYDSLGATFINCPDGYNALCDELYKITAINLH